MENVGFAKEVFDKLVAVDIQKYIKKKNGLDYVSWSYCWSFLMIQYPNSSYKFNDVKFFNDNTCEVWVSVTVSDGISSIEREMALAVFDYSNKAIKGPSSTQICNSRMRCLVKCIAMFGLGMSLYAGEDLPEAKPDLVKNSTDWNNVVNAISSKKKTLVDALGKYNISSANQAEIKKIVLERSNAATQPQAVAQ